MAQVSGIEQKQKPKHKPIVYITSSLVQASSDDLEQLINEKLQENVALETVDQPDALYNGPERDEGGEFDADEEEKTANLDSSASAVSSFSTSAVSEVLCSTVSSVALVASLLCFVHATVLAAITTTINKLYNFFLIILYILF